jgi:hypothetical protein
VLLALQRTHGNRYVQRVVAGIQAKLKIGQPGDIYEQEADRVAEEVMQMPEHKVQRQTDEEKKEEELIQSKPSFEQIIPMGQRQVEEEEDEEIPQPKEYSGKATEVTLDIEKNITALKGSGQPLSESVRAFFEPRFGYDFSQVRIHADTQASEFAQTANARAFTLGRNMVFGAGQYQPETSSGRYLLAHELVHVVQQSQNFAIFHRSTANDRVDDTPDSSKIAQITNLRMMGKDKLESNLMAAPPGMQMYPGGMEEYRSRRPPGAQVEAVRETLRLGLPAATESGVKICYVPLAAFPEWLPYWASPIDHAFIEFDDGWSAGFTRQEGESKEDARIISPEPRRNDPRKTCYAAERKDSEECQTKPSNEIKRCIQTEARKDPGRYHAILNNCGDWVKRTFNNCCLKPKTPGHIY